MNKFTRIYIYICSRICTDTDTSVSIHIYTYIHAHTYTYIYVLRWPQPFSLSCYAGGQAGELASGGKKGSAV